MCFDRIVNSSRPEFDRHIFPAIILAYIRSNIIPYLYFKYSSYMIRGSTWSKSPLFEFLFKLTPFYNFSFIIYLVIIFYLITWLGHSIICRLSSITSKTLNRMTFFAFMYSFIKRFSRIVRYRTLWTTHWTMLLTTKKWIVKFYFQILDNLCIICLVKYF